MRQIRSYELAADGGDQTLSMPADATYLGINHSEGAVLLWYIVDDARPTEERMFCVAGEGDDLPSWANLNGYIDMIDVRGAADHQTVHVFEQVPDDDFGFGA